MSISDKLQQVIPKETPWKLSLFLLLLSLLFEFHREIAAFLSASARRNDKLLANIKSRIDLVDISKKADIAISADALEALSEDISQLLSKKVIKEKPAKTPGIPRRIRYPFGAAGGLLLAFILRLLGPISDVEFPVLLVILVFFSLIGVLSTAFFTSRRSGKLFSFIIGIVGSFAFIAIAIALAASH